MCRHDGCSQTARKHGRHEDDALVSGILVDVNLVDLKAEEGCGLRRHFERIFNVTLNPKP